jgi:integrase/recombinase XerD
MNPLRRAAADYIALRRSVGYKLRDPELILNDFVDYLEKNNADRITATLAVNWATLPRQAQPSHWSRRLGVVRGFAKHYCLIDSRTEIPSSLLLPYRTQRANPHIYTSTEIERLLSACQWINTQGLRHLTYYTLFGLLVVSGCRIGEIIALDRGDFNKTDGMIMIRNSKFRKSRYIPLHLSSVRKLNDYSRARDQFHRQPTTQSFFVSEKGRRLTVNGVEIFFKRLSRSIGLRAPHDKHGPRIHDIRHTFAVNTLIHWYKTNVNIDQKMPYLSAYLGHKKPSDTYWYISSIPELIALASQRLEEHGGWSHEKK